MASAHPAPRTAHPRLTAIRRGVASQSLRLVVSVALLAVLVTRIDLDRVLPEQRHLSTLAWFAAGVTVTIAGVLLSAWRWRRVLDAFDAPGSIPVLASHSFAGQFVGNVLPSTIGGDVLRVSRASKTTGSSEVAFASVVLERLSGFLALPVLSLAGFALRPSLLDADRAWIALAIAGASLAMLVAILVVVAHPRLAGRFAGADRWTRFVGAIHIGMDGLRRRPRLAWRVLAASVVYQLSTVAAEMCAVKVMNVSVPLAAILAFAPAVAMVQVLPLSIGGLGVREGMLVLLLGGLGVSAGAAVGVGLVWYAQTLAASLLGAPAFAMGHRFGVREDARESGVREDARESGVLEDARAADARQDADGR
jgi:uncharacterized membrane protein YbhN (UPF0104 family)